MQAGSGDTMLAVADRTVRVETGSGDVQVTVVGGTAVWMDVISLSGSVHSALARSEPPREGEDTVALHINTVSGDISLAHA